MLVAVSERTQEIGLRKALGATNRNILFHFFLEGLLLTLGSGLIGMVMAGGLMAMMGGIHLSLIHILSFRSLIVVKGM